MVSPWKVGAMCLSDSTSRLAMAFPETSGTDCGQQLNGTNPLAGYAYSYNPYNLDAYDYYTSEAGGKKGSAMLGDEMIDEASRKMALVIAGKGRAAGMQRTSSFTPPES